MALILVALQLSEERVSMSNRRIEIIEGLNQLPGQIKEVLELDAFLKKMASEHFVKEKSLLLVGRGYQSATVLEGALKIKEVSYIHSEGILAGELKHGTLALVDSLMPIIFVLTKDGIYPVNTAPLCSRKRKMPLSRSLQDLESRWSYATQTIRRARDSPQS